MRRCCGSILSYSTPLADLKVEYSQHITLQGTSDFISSESSALDIGNDLQDEHSIPYDLGSKHQTYHFIPCHFAAFISPDGLAILRISNIVLWERLLRLLEGWMKFVLQAPLCTATRPVLASLHIFTRSYILLVLTNGFDTTVFDQFNENTGMPSRWPEL